MKTFIQTLFFCLTVSLGLASTAWSASLPAMLVKVTTASGKVVYKGTTNASGAFTTPQLSPGNYVVQFNSKSTPKGGPFALVVEAGKIQAFANSVSGSKFSAGGVAMKIDVATAARLSGHISQAGVGAVTKGSTPAPPDGIRMENGVKVKYTHGKKYIWVENPMSTLGGHWAPEKSPEAKNPDYTHK